MMGCSLCIIWKVREWNNKSWKNLRIIIGGGVLHAKSGTLEHGKRVAVKRAVCTGIAWARDTPYIV